MLCVTAMKLTIGLEKVGASCKMFVRPLFLYPPLASFSNFFTRSNNVVSSGLMRAHSTNCVLPLSVDVYILEL